VLKKACSRCTSSTENSRSRRGSEPRTRRVDPLDVDREPGVQREDVVVVGQEGVRRALRIQTGLDEVGSADNCRGSIDVDVALVEQTEPEFLQQQPPHRDVDSVLGYS
jgi:hypothetical protein